MISIPDQYLVIAVPASYGLLIFIGTVQLGYGIAILSGNEDSDPFTSDLGLDNNITGVLNIVFGICCLVSALLKWNTLLIISSTLVALTTLVNLISLFSFIGDAASSSEWPRLHVTQESLRTQYGRSLVFTLQVDGYQELNSCCGWTGLDGDNVYLNTPWHKMANKNATGKPKTLPTSCCVLPDDVHCTTAENVKEAREKGLVYKKVCTDIGVRSRPPMWPSVLLLVLNLLIQIACVAAAVFTVFKST